jgi:hypothetical protein
MLHVGGVGAELSVTLRAEPCALQEIRTEWDIIYLYIYLYQRE